MVKRQKFKATIVVPTIREESILKFLSLWKDEFEGHRVIVVEDNPQKTFPLPKWVEHYCWQDINRELGKKSWIIPRRSDTVRSYGYYKAWQKKTDFIVTLDDDCYPEEKYSKSYLELMKDNLDKEWLDDSWWNTLEEVYPRGVPYEIRNKKKETIIHHGLWSNVPDLDAKTQKRMPDYRTKPSTKTELIPVGKFFPMCGMNLAFRAEAVPMLYFLLMGKDLNEQLWPFDRFGDIWAGVLVKKIADHLGLAISSGMPSIHHSRASNVETNWRKEKPGLPVNEILWKKVKEVKLNKKTIKDCYVELFDKLDMEGDYWEKLNEAVKVWSSLF